MFSHSIDRDLPLLGKDAWDPYPYDCYPYQRMPCDSRSVYSPLQYSPYSLPNASPFGRSLSPVYRKSSVDNYWLLPNQCNSRASPLLSALQPSSSFRGALSQSERYGVFSDSLQSSYDYEFSDETHYEVMKSEGINAFSSLPSSIPSSRSSYPSQVTELNSDSNSEMPFGKHLQQSQFTPGKDLSVSDSSSSSSAPSHSTRVHSQQQVVSKEIDLESVKNDSNKRLTVMIRNIPNRYSPDNLRAFLDNCIANCYSIVSFPKDDFTSRNLGYAFVSLTSNQALHHLIENTQDKPWPNSNSMKHCHICHSIDKKARHRKRKGGKK